jgi:hypothetical protein
MEELGRGGLGNRSLYVLDIPHPDDVPATLALPSRDFVCLLAWDALLATDLELAAVAGRLLRAGCAFAVCWGPDCGRVSGAFDLADLEWRPDGPWAMTSWHVSEPLAEAIWFALFAAWPHEALEDSCGSLVGISIGSRVWAAEMRSAFANPDEFSARHIGSGPDAESGNERGG